MAEFDSRRFLPPAVQRMMEEQKRLAASRQEQIGPSLLETLGPKRASMTYKGIPRGPDDRLSQPSPDFLELQAKNTARIEAAQPSGRERWETGRDQRAAFEGLDLDAGGGFQREIDEAPPEPPLAPWPDAPLPPRPQGPTGTAGGDIGAGLGPGQADPRLGSLGPMPGLQAPPTAPGSEVWEQEASREKDLGRLGMAREISEGLKLAGRSLVGLSGAQIPEGDDTARDIRGLIAKKEDEISPQMRQMLASKGLVIPEGISMDKLIKMGIVPQHFAGQRAAAGLEARVSEGGLERGSREGIAAAGVTGRADIAAKGVTSREKIAGFSAKESLRRYEQDRTESTRRWEVDREMAEKKFGRLADKELAEIDQMEVSIAGMKAIAAERIEKGYYTGPMDSRGAKIGAWLGFGVSPESIEWRRKVISQLNLYIKEMTGAQLSAAEAKRLMLGLPTDKDQEEFFDAKIKGTIEELERKRDSFLRTRRWAGKDTEPYDRVEYKVGRRTARVPGGDIAGFEEEYPDARRQRRAP